MTVEYTFELAILMFLWDIDFCQVALTFLVSFILAFFVLLKLFGKAILTMQFLFLVQ